MFWVQIILIKNPEDYLKTQICIVVVTDSNKNMVAIIYVVMENLLATVYIKHCIII